MTHWYDSSFVILIEDDNMYAYYDTLQKLEYSYSLECNCWHVISNINCLESLTEQEANDMLLNVLRKDVYNQRFFLIRTQPLVDFLTIEENKKLMYEIVQQQIKEYKFNITDCGDKNYKCVYE